MNKHVNKHKKVKEYKKPEKKKTFADFLKCAPYTVIMIASVLGFWGYKAVSFANDLAAEKQTENFAADAEEKVDPFSEIGQINSELSAPDETEITNGSDMVNSETGTTEDITGEIGEGSESDVKMEDGMSEGANSDGGAAAEETADPENEDEPEPVDRFANLTEEELAAYPFSLGEISDNVIVYEAKDIDSRYYSDPGMVALDTPADYVTVEDDYYEDACFIGDSRMVGIYDYSGWSDADFYCDNGYCVYNYKGGKTVLCQNNGKKYTLEEAMNRKKYGKIYIMIGTNDCGYGNTESFQSNYSDMLDMLKEKQPDAIIFMVANLRVSQKAEREDKTGVYNNIDINDKNFAISQLADGVTTFYFDCNVPFVDEKGYLIEENTFDGFHVYAKQYVEMSELFKAHGIVK